MARFAAARFAGALLLLSLAAQVASALDDEPHVILESAPGPQAVGSTWILTVLTDHADPSRVSVAAPDFPEGIVLEQALQGSRLVGADSRNRAGERWTATEYRFLLASAGSHQFGPFSVTTPLGRATTRPFTLEVADASGSDGARVYRTFWAEPPENLNTGESATLALILEPNGLGETPPERILFMPEVPPGHILESLPVGPPYAAPGTVLRLRLIPLEPGVFSLEARRFRHGDSLFEIPALRIPVAHARARLEVAAHEGEAFVPVAQVPSPPFPPVETARDKNPRVFQRNADEFGAVYLAALGLWERGLMADALAVLRRNERDGGAAGELFAAVRREAEAALGLVGTPDERRGFVLPFSGGRARIAVLRETTARRVPDPAGEETAKFAEGQPATPDGNPGAGRWVRVTTSDGRSGWIPGENIIIY